MVRTGLFLLGVLLCSSTGLAQNEPSVVSAWVAAPAPGATWAAAYVELKNPGMYDLFVVSAKSDVATSVELRGAAAAGGESAVVPEFTVPAYGGVAAAPTAPHLRLVGLTRTLAVGDTVPLVLTTDGGVSLRVSATVRTP